MIRFKDYLKKAFHNPEMKTEYEKLQEKYDPSKYCFITASDFSKNIDEYLDRVDTDHKILIITDETSRSVVLMRAKDYKRMKSFLRDKRNE